ncbi:hypothetical protein B5M09_010099 [Aphanomyces astaci]|uniref:Uncharacterized protein n=1 Tax=Aphanomyces astaci TaxID=112090 RepID=A0A3R7W857_APHAT|nr:hypothetical protein B5M09_010099 [Aphanomyces astaci]
MQLKRLHTCCQNADPHRWPTQSYCGVTLLKKAENTPTNVDSKRVAASRLDAMVHLVATRAPIAPARLAGSSASLELMCVGYVVGLLLTNAGLILMRSGQPVLLYLVPSKLGVLVVAQWLTNGLLRKLWDRPTEFNQLQRWTGSPPTPPPPSPSKSFELKMQAYRAYSGRDFAQYIKLCSCALEALDKELESGSRRPFLQAEKAILLMHRASSLTLAGKVHEALQDGIAAVELDRKNLRAHICVAKCCVLLGKADDAKEAYRHVDLILRGLNRRLYPRLDDYRAQLHEGLLAVESLESLLREINRCTVANDNKGALRATEDAIAIAIGSQELRLQKVTLLLTLWYGNIWLQSGSPSGMYNMCCSESDKAEDCRRRLDQKGASGGRTSVGIKMAVLYCRALHYHDKTEQAFEVLEQLLRVAPTSVDLLHVKRLWELMEDVSLAAYEASTRGDYNKAVLLYTKALTLDKHHRTYNASVLGSRATTYMALAQYDKAVQDCNAALKYRPVYFKVLLRRARCYDIMNLYKESVADYDEYMAKAKVTPDDLRHVHKAKTAQDGELFKYMSAAYGVLSDKQLKAAYDMELRYRGH